MKRWMHGAPQRGDPWRGWLVHSGSLTGKLAAHGGPVRVELTFQGLRAALPDECRLLGHSVGRAVLVREVVLHVGGRAVVVAHSVASPGDLRGAWRSLGRLGTRPLAEALFADRRVRRESLSFARLGPLHPLHALASRAGAQPLPARLWARRSRFTRIRRPLLVTEIFLPGVLALGGTRP
jgi:chorismate--pyruvate lyase